MQQHGGVELRRSNCTEASMFARSNSRVPPSSTAARPPPAPKRRPPSCRGAREVRHVVAALAQPPEIAQRPARSRRRARHRGGRRAAVAARGRGTGARPRPCRERGRSPPGASPAVDEGVPSRTRPPGLSGCSVLERARRCRWLVSLRRDAPCPRRGRSQARWSPLQTVRRRVSEIDREEVVAVDHWRHLIAGVG